MYTVNILSASPFSDPHHAAGVLSEAELSFWCHSDHHSGTILKSHIFLYCTWSHRDPVLGVSPSVRRSAVPPWVWRPDRSPSVRRSALSPCLWRSDMSPSVRRSTISPSAWRSDLSPSVRRSDLPPIVWRPAVSPSVFSVSLAGA